jgi:putative ABC transport system ATP-binding protein
MSNNGTAVSLRGVTKSYGTGTSRVQALRGVDLDVRLGELLMLVGPSGCGKTTLISVVAAILDHDDGEIVVFDRSLKAMSPAEKTRFRGANIGFVFQAYNLIPTISVTENVAIPLLILGRRRADAMARAAEMLAAVGLGDKL